MISYVYIKNHKRGEKERERQPLDNSPCSLKQLNDRNYPVSEFFPSLYRAANKVFAKLISLYGPIPKIRIQINIQMSLIPMICLLSSNSPQGCLAIQTAA